MCCTRHSLIERHFFTGFVVLFVALFVDSNLILQTCWPAAVPIQSIIFRAGSGTFVLRQKLYKTKSSLLHSVCTQSSLYTWRVVFLISAATYVGSGLLFACLVPAEVQEWNTPQKTEVDGEKGLAKVELPSIMGGEAKYQDT